MLYPELKNYIKSICAEIGLNFYKRSWEDFYAKAKTTKYPAFLLNESDFVIDDTKRENPVKVRVVSFMVVSHCKDKTDEAAMDLALGSAETLADRFVNRMRAGAKAPFASRENIGFDLADVEASEIENETVGAYGYYITMKVKSLHNKSL